SDNSSHSGSLMRKSGRARVSRGISLNLPPTTFSKRNAHGSQAQAIRRFAISSKCRCVGGSATLHRSQCSGSGGGEVPALGAAAARRRSAAKEEDDINIVAAKVGPAKHWQGRGRPAIAPYLQAGG